MESIALYQKMRPDLEEGALLEEVELDSRCELLLIYGEVLCEGRWEGDWTQSSGANPKHNVFSLQARVHSNL